MSTSHQQATALIQSGFAAQGRGELEGAEAAYRAALRLVPEHPTALQLLGLAARRAGDLATAEDLMRRSLRTHPAQPHVWNNLGNLLDDTQRPDEALACFDRAIQLDARYADAHYNRARVLLARQRWPEAAQAAAAAAAAATVAARPSAELLQLQAQIQTEQGDLGSALRTLEQALALAPDKPALLHNKATVLQRSHRYEAALQVHERAQSLGLDAADAHYNLGNTLQSLGRHDQALAAYRRALSREPEHRLALLDLARLRWRLGEPDFDAELLAAAQAHPASSTALDVHAQLLWRAERHAEAAQAYESALARSPGVAAFHDGLGRCQVRMGDWAAGLDAHRRAVALGPHSADLRSSFAASLLVARQPQEADIQATRACELAPHDQYAWALRGLVWRLLGDPREHWLNDIERFVQVVDLAPPAGYRDMAAFHQEMLAELLALHQDRDAPVDQTLRHGTQTLGDVFEQGHALVDALKARIAQAIAGYVAQLPADPAHPFLGRRSAGWRFTDSWSTCLRDRGFHTNHVHPHGWISSAYYVAVPEVCANVTQQQGWLQFGAPDLDVGLSHAARLHLQPVPGRLVLFPSMLWHGTAPFHSAQRRVTIAFDVKPV